jgi:hypothetical protein
MIASFRWKSLPVLVALGIRRLGMLICVLRVLLRLGRMLLALGTVVSPGASATAQWDFAAVSAYTSIEPVWTFKDRGRSNKEKQKTDDACLHREIVSIAHWKPRLQSIQHGPVIVPPSLVSMTNRLICAMRTPSVLLCGLDDKPAALIARTARVARYSASDRGMEPSRPYRFSGNGLGKGVVPTRAA